MPAWTSIPGRLGQLLAYRLRLLRERRRYDDQAVVHDLPPIFHYWSHTYVRPLLLELGVDGPEAFFAHQLAAAARRTGAAPPAFLSVGAGNCDTELAVAARLRALGLHDFTIDCVDLNRAMLARGRAAAFAQNLAQHVRPVRADLNRFAPARRYAAVMANHSLHHVQALEHLFDGVQRALLPGGAFVVSDMIGRNGHQRWPEALAEVRAFWRELPDACRWNHQLRRHEHEFLDWDCSRVGFEGIRAQDILPALVERFQFAVFVGFANVVDVFVDRAFGPNFAADRAADRAFVDRVHARDEELLRAGLLTPTHMFAVLGNEPASAPHFARGLAPARCIRHPDRAPGQAPPSGSRSLSRA